MDWSQLKSFYYIATLGSVSRAAAAVYRSQSALSQQLKALESTMHCTLFTRIGKQKMVLTEEGKQLFGFAEDVFLRHRQLMESIENTRLKRKGYLRIAGGTATLSLMLPDVVVRFSTQYPDVSVTLYEKSPDKALDMLSQGKIDVAIALASRIPGNLGTHPWLTGHFSLMLPKEHPLLECHPVSLEDLSRYPLIKLASNSKFGSTDILERALFDQGVPIHVFMEASNIYLMAEYVRRGFGISMVTVPESGLNLFRDELAFLPLDHLFPPEEILMCTRKDVELSPIVRAFMACVYQPQRHGHQPCGFPA